MRPIVALTLNSTQALEEGIKLPAHRFRKTLRVAVLPFFLNWQRIFVLLFLASCSFLFSDEETFAQFSKLLLGLVARYVCFAYLRKSGHPHLLQYTIEGE